MALHNTVHSCDRDVVRIVGGLQDALYCIDAATGEYTYVNPAFESLTGYSIEDIRALGGRIGFDDRTRTSGAEADRGLTSPARPVPSLAEEERWFRRKDGTVICLEDTASTVTEEGIIVAYTGILRDITDRKTWESETLEKLTLLRTVVDGLPDIVYAKDRQGRHLLSNTAELRERLSGAPEFTRLDQQVLRTGEAIINQQVTLEDATGGKRYLLSTKVPFRDADGTIAGLVGISHDITDRHRAEEALRMSDERFRLVSENVADLLAILDTTGECEFASPSHLQDGHAPHALVNKSYLALIHTDDLPYVRERFAMVADGMGHQSIEFRFRRADGSWRYKDASLTLIVDDGGERLLIIARDITERKHQEEQRQSLERQISERNAVLEKTIAEVRQMQEGLIQSEKMASIGQLTAGIAHEINNPLAFVSSNLNRFGEYFHDVVGILSVWNAVKEELQKDPQFAPLIAMVAKAEEQADIGFAIENFPVLMTHTSEGTERIRSIVDRLRGFSHMATSSFAEADINAALDDTINLTWNELKYKATIVKDYGEIPRVSCNVGEVKQVLVNLLVNAAQALKDKGTITLRTREENGALVVQVIDTGSGIPEAHLKRIFDPFFTTKAVGKGTGLGLWISATIIQKHGGTLTVDSTEGIGTTMTITIPLAHDDAMEGAA